MITERQEQIETATEVLSHAENYLRAIDLLANLQACDLLADLRLELVIEWDEIDAKKCEAIDRLYCERHAESRATLNRLWRVGEIR